MPSAVLEQLHDDLAADLDRVVARFKPGVKVTLVIRHPDIPGDAGVVIGNDDLDAAIEEIRRRKAREAIAAAANNITKLTDIQEATLEYLHEYIVAHGVPPTISELMVAFRIRSANCMWQRLNAMRKKGVLQHTPYVSRGWRPV